MEQHAGGSCFGGFLHCPGHMPKIQEVLPQNDVSCATTSQWHDVAFEWSAGWVAGQLWYDIPANADLIQMLAGHLTIQQDD